MPNGFQKRQRYLQGIGREKIKVSRHNKTFVQTVSLTDNSCAPLAGSTGSFEIIEVHRVHSEHEKNELANACNSRELALVSYPLLGNEARY
jgi:hypothetical protein